MLYRQWTKRAACDGMAPLFDPPESTPTNRWLMHCWEVCQQCPVRRECDQESQREHPIKPIGWWGGTLYIMSGYKWYAWRSCKHCGAPLSSLSTRYPSCLNCGLWAD